MNEYKVAYIESIKRNANSIINQHQKDGYYPIQISYSTGFGGHGLVILFKKKEDVFQHE